MILSRKFLSITGEELIIYLPPFFLAENNIYFMVENDHEKYYFPKEFREICWEFLFTE